MRRPCGRCYRRAARPLGSRPVRLALMIEGQEGVTWDDWVAIAETCERSGIEALFRSDHYVSGTEESRPVLDAWATISGLAACTTTLQLGTLVSPATFRHPAILVRNAATADEISDGRVTLGMGAGWMEREHEAYGIDFFTARGRVARFGEQLEIAHRLLREARVDFDGTYYQLRGAPGLNRPKLPLLVGGSAKPGTAEPAVRFADEYNTFFATVEEVRERKQRLDETCGRAAPACGCAESAPARPEDQREQDADRADDQQDVADGVQVEAVRRHVNRPREHCADGDQDDAHSDAHAWCSFLRKRRE